MDTFGWELQAMREGIREFGSLVVVLWHPIAGGTTEPVTLATVGGSESLMSGTLYALEYQVEARTELRRFAEISAGDLILDIDPEGCVNVMSGTVCTAVPLDSLSGLGVQFQVDGQLYVQREVGEELASAWRTRVGGKALYRTLLLKRTR